MPEITHPSMPVSEDLYSILEVDRLVSQQGLKDAYVRLFRFLNKESTVPNVALRLEQLNTAYDVLIHPGLRTSYDLHGLSGMDNEEALTRLFRGETYIPCKGPSLSYPAYCFLDDLYRGKTVKLGVTREIIVGDISDCENCHGKGTTYLRTLGPGMYTQALDRCDFCRGVGCVAKKKNERKVVTRLSSLACTMDKESRFLDSDTIRRKLIQAT